ncbi:MAG: toll/interleukin-1 receptor domain-containing protein [Betaproteobacteria bacterium]|nr:toll/interleukin-1 receptor domain-containing protein [Betaproteobacteria bacterium]
MTEKIFVSYAYQDRAIAERVQDHLRTHGIVATADIEILDPQKGIQAGDNIREMIKAQMMAASKVVIITSSNSAQSQWVNYEAGMAAALGKPIIAIVAHHGSRKTDFLTSLGDVRTIEIDDAG